MQIVFNTLYWTDMLREALPPLMSARHAAGTRFPTAASVQQHAGMFCDSNNSCSGPFWTSDLARCFWKTGPFLVACFILTKELFPFICVSYMFTLYLTLPKRKTILNVLSLLFSKVSASFVLRWGRSRDRVPLCGELPYCLWQPHYRWRHLSLFALLFKSD